ncbi:hypothetical protein [Citrobacter amalonaticus]|uniref:hypothetical protein n=1 Tax=Citrobacter amalonaticus TaxID=35703 RepID=UPI0011AF8FCA|nr:hypothetical protein [Citrobacter amalonaticus]
MLKLISPVSTAVGLAFILPVMLISCISRNAQAELQMPRAMIPLESGPVVNNASLRFIPDSGLRAGVKDSGTLLGKLVVDMVAPGSEVAVQFAPDRVGTNGLGTQGYIVNQGDGSRINSAIQARECGCTAPGAGPSGANGYASTLQGDLVLVTHGRQTLTPGRYQIKLVAAVMLP